MISNVSVKQKVSFCYRYRGGVMNIYKCILELINMSEWLQHISGVLEQTQDKSDLLERICDFDFKFNTTLQ